MGFSGIFFIMKKRSSFSLSSNPIGYIWGYMTWYLIFYIIMNSILRKKNIQLFFIFICQFVFNNNLVYTNPNSFYFQRILQIYTYKIYIFSLIEEILSHIYILWTSTSSYSNNHSWRWNMYFFQFFNIMDLVCFDY